MPTKLNSEFNYRYQVAGETVWEKIKTLKGFLQGRIRAAALEDVGAVKYRSKVSEVEWLKSNNSPEHVILNATAELLELESFMIGDVHTEAYELNRQEIATLEKLIAELLAIAEPTRIPGYSDEEMFEANAANEFAVWVCKEIHAEILANGRPSPAKLRNAMSNPVSWEALKQSGLIDPRNELLEFSNDPSNVRISIPVVAIENNQGQEKLSKT